MSKLNKKEIENLKNNILNKLEKIKRFTLSKQSNLFYYVQSLEEIDDDLDEVILNFESNDYLDR